MGLNLFSGQLSVDNANVSLTEEKENFAEGKRKPASATRFEPICLQTGKV